MKLKHYTELDGIRAIAALMIIFFHFFQHLQVYSPFLLTIKRYSIFGQTGVSLFFVLSGFLITRILLNTKNEKGYLKNFYIRRTLRIFPLYYLFLIIFYFIVPYFEKTSITPFNYQIYFWVYLQNIAMTFNWTTDGPGHFWSLAVEEHFYLFWPFLIFLLDKKRINIAIVVIIILSLLTGIVLSHYNFYSYFFTFSRMDELAVGALLATLEINGRLIKSNSKYFNWLLILLIIPALGIWVVSPGKSVNDMQIFKFILPFFYFGVIGLAITINDSNWIKRLLKFNFFTYTGKISYGLYVFHPLCFYLIAKYFKIDSIAVSFLLSLLFTYLIASASYYLFESKFLALKNRFKIVGSQKFEKVL